MKTKLIALVLPLLVVLAPHCKAQGTPPPDAQQAESIVNNLKYRNGGIDIQGGIAKLTIPPDFKYLDAEDAKAVLTKIWDNPPDRVEGVLGMIMPANQSPVDDDCWAVTISYEERGYIKDDDASKINYGDLLRKLKANDAEDSKSGVEKGYQPYELIGWATPPHYDAATHKLYWATELKVGNHSVNTLNYDIRILGRRGVLVLGAIASMEQLSEIEQNNPKILSMVNFNDGNRYADFDPKIDKVAEYGIGALILGGIAAKVGFFKLLLVGILALKKFIIIGFVALVAAVKRLFGGRKQT